MKHNYVQIAQEFGFDKSVSVSQIQSLCEKVYAIAMDDAFFECFEKRNSSLPNQHNAAIAMCCNTILALKGVRHI